MLAPMTSLTSTRPVSPAISQEVCVGAPSCRPLLQYELLKALANQAPRVYARATRELGLTVDRARTLVERGDLVSASRAIRLARLIAHETNNQEIFSEAGHSLFTTLYRELPFSLRLTASTLPRSLRTRLALSVARRITHHFAGASSHLRVRRQRGRLYLTITDAVFADRLETLTGAHEFYRAVIETLFRQFAHVECKVVPVKRARINLYRCCFEIAWDA
jgi:hypothetical protein